MGLIGVNSSVWNFTCYDLNDPCRDKWAGVICTCYHFPITNYYSNYISYYYTTDNRYCCNCNVEKLILIKYNLVGTLPSSFRNLTNAKRILLQDNNLYGTIPSSFGQMTNLQYLYVGYNQLSGVIPSSFGQLTNLQYLYLTYNQLTGTIPSSFGQMANLQYLYVAGYNNLAGIIPSSFGQRTNLKGLNLDTDQLTGTISSSFGQMSNPIILSLRTNQLSGKIPSNIGDSSITKFIILGGFIDSVNNSYDNHFTGQIPSTYCNYTSLFLFSIPSNNKTCYPICLYSKLTANYLAISSHCPNNEDTALCDLAESTNIGKIVREVTFPYSQVISSPHPIPYGYEISRNIAVPDVIYYTISLTGTCDLPIGDVIYICIDSNNCPTCDSLPLEVNKPSFIIKYKNNYPFFVFYGY